MLDALVMICANTEFTNWIFNQISKLQIAWANFRHNKDFPKDRSGNSDGIGLAVISTNETMTGDSNVSEKIIGDANASSVVSV